MATTTSGCTSVAPTSQQNTCLPCDIPVFCRNSYYRGKLLTERDFNDEQRYGIDKMRLHQLSLHGWGVVCGLIVKPHPYCPDQRLVVTTGLAIDDCGRDIRLLREDCVYLPQPVPGAPPPAPPPPSSSKPPAPSNPPTPSTPAPGQNTPPTSANTPPSSTASTPPSAATESLAHVTPDPGAPSHEYASSGESDDDDGPRQMEDPCDPLPVPIDLYLCIRYSECETEFAPAPFDDCSCSTSSQRPNRVCEGYTLELYQSKPSFWEKATERECELDDCGLYYRQARECCPETNCAPCVPLAIICDFVPGQPVKAEQIDNWTPRRQMASLDTLDQVIRCILTKLPTQQFTRIEDCNWEHNRRMLCREFIEEFVGTAERPKGFRLEFSGKVRTAEIDTRSFQALVVFRPDNGSEPRPMQIAPARVEHEHDDTTWARLVIDPGYARRHLDGRSFDLFISLKCDVIRDEHGRAVDGNFIGHHFPTGDNIQGGNFESWVRVRPRSAHP
jgi:hypothetical protein